MTGTTLHDIHRIADDVVEARPDWELGAVLSVLLSVKDRGTREMVRAAALRAANDPSTRAPVAMTWPVFWAPKRQTTNTFVPANPLPECRHCATPAPRTANPQFCGACGMAWEPILFRPDRQRDRLEAAPCPPGLRAQLQGLWST